MRLLADLRTLDIESCLTENRPGADGERTQWNKKNKHAISVIMHSLNDSQLEYMQDCDTAKSMVDRLEESFVANSHVSMVTFVRKLMQLHLNNKQDWEKHISEFITITGDLNTVGFKLTDKHLRIFLLATLGENFNSFRTWINMRDLNF
ncbi:hypothetical protein JRQ81_012388 [Phrynocephalus forsythii]|uniref:Uncharacterized protein n=1 Tax=Phrynocephalus forsythii TaxID=171643 RepID=A0A9Q0X8X0_9SAUR|nr:hypothetical protein JRQ81_012388 [Phrynocephalus forsythii]